MLIDSSKSIVRVINRKLGKYNVHGTVHTTEPHAAWISAPGKSCSVLVPRVAFFRASTVHITTLRSNQCYDILVNNRVSRFMTKQEREAKYNEAKMIDEECRKQNEELVGEMMEQIRGAITTSFIY